LVELTPGVVRHKQVGLVVEVMVAGAVQGVEVATQEVEHQTIITIHREAGVAPFFMFQQRT
jgi:hypothetical protein